MEVDVLLLPTIMDAMPCTLGDVGLGVMGHRLVIVGWQ
jgi:hypothetical protein